MTNTNIPVLFGATPCWSRYCKREH